MDSFFRFLLRLILVPLGYLSAVVAGATVILVGEWRIGTLFQTSQPDEAAMGVVVAIVTSVFVLVLMLSTLWLVAAVGILFSEAFAVRSWIFHAGNGVVSAWIGAALFSPGPSLPSVAEDPFYVVAAGLAGGLAYWLVAGSTAGFFKPVLRSAAERAGYPSVRGPAGPAPQALPPPSVPPGGQGAAEGEAGRPGNARP